MNKLADNQTVEQTIQALKANNINAISVQTGDEARKKVLEMIPEGAEVMTMTSVTLQTLNLVDELNDSGKYNSVKSQLSKLNRETDSLKMQKIGAAAEWSIGSVHAVTQDGQVVVASNSGSQLPGYAYGSQHVIWIVGTQKIVKNMDDAMKRINEYVLPLESERARKAYGVAGSNVSKLLIFNKEVNPERITLIFVNEALGF